MNPSGADRKVINAERANAEWLADLEPLGTDHDKPFLTTAPALIVAFAQKAGPESEQHYYVQTSVGLACGFLIAALHDAGLATLTHTPSPMGFLANCLGASEHERPFVLIPIGWPHPNAMVPDQERKPLDDILTIH